MPCNTKLIRLKNDQIFGEDPLPVKTHRGGPMPLSLWYDDDADLSLIQARTVSIIGYGNQGRAHGCNLRDSGVSVLIGARQGGKAWLQAQADGFKPVSIAEAVGQSDVVMVLLPDEVMADVYETEIQPALKPGAALMFSHGFNIHFKKIMPPSTSDVLMVAPKGAGYAVRRAFEAGGGVPCLVAIHQDVSGGALSLALSYAKAIGGTRAGVFQTTFREETETDLFSEQVVLCGGLTRLIECGFQTLVEAGYSPVMAYFECLHEVKLIADLVHERGLAAMREAISNTAEFGDYLAGPEIIDEQTQERMRQVLKRIQSGKFAEQMLGDFKAGAPWFLQKRRERIIPELESTGREIREKLRTERIKGN